MKRMLALMAVCGVLIYSTETFSHGGDSISPNCYHNWAQGTDAYHCY